MHSDWVSAAERTNGRQKYVVKLDIAACFDMINLDVLKKIVDALVPSDRYRSDVSMLLFVI